MGYEEDLAEAIRLSMLESSPNIPLSLLPSRIVLLYRYNLECSDVEFLLSASCDDIVPLVRYSQ